MPVTANQPKQPNETWSLTTMKTPTALLAGLALGFTVLIERVAVALKAPQAT